MEATIQYKDRHERYRKENAERVALSKRTYAENNREKNRARNKKRREENPEEAKAYYQANKERILAKNAEWKAANPEKAKAIYSDWYLKNKDQHNAKCREWWDKNKEAIKPTTRAYYRANRHIFTEAASMRRECRRQAMPKWLTKEDRIKIRDFYREAHRISEETGVIHHVDHIHPLRGEFVCGLHVPWNLQVITASENLAKRNKLILWL